MQNPAFRVLYFLMVLVAVVVLPWWISIFILAGLTIYISFYLEILFFGFLFDSLYSANFSFPYTWLTVSTVFLLATVLVKTQIRK